MATSTTAPVLQNLTVECGADWSAEVNFTDGITGDPINLSSPEMQVRTEVYVGSPLLVTPQISVSENSITISISGEASTAVYAAQGYYDLFATRTDTNQVVKLIYGQVAFQQNVTEL